MIKRQVLSLSFCLVLLLCGKGQAHHPTNVAGTGHAGPIITVSATTIEKGKVPVVLQSEYIDMDPFSDNDLEGFSNNGRDAHSIDSIFHMVLGIGYGLTDDLTLGFKLPYIQVDNIREAHSDEPGEIHRHGDAKGIGDISIFGQYRFLRMRDSGIESSILLGLKMPTGRKTDKDINGERFETEFQPGSGAWSPIAGIAFTKRYERISIDSNIMYTLATEGSLDTDLGDMFNYNASVSYRAGVNKQIKWDLILEANGEWKQKQETGGVKDANSGGNAIFISPGTRVSWRQWSAYLSVGLPVVQDLNGIQNEVSTKTMAGIIVGF